ncbi:MAG: RNA polymerase factor sigma-54 [Candidatus Saganbacteria bacterium]|nr:RNA polymerase factor sigma-54 [Candidatus Saganbacteria bacterium]
MVNLSSNLSLNLSQELELMLSPRLIAMLKTLQLSYQDLVSDITARSEENVMLEIEKHDRLLEYIKFMSSDKSIKKEADFTELPGLKNVQDSPESLDEYLLHQLKLLEIEEDLQPICEKLIENVDDQGYILAYDKLNETLKKELKTTDTKIAAALEIIQSLEPTGIGARDLKECLTLQVKDYNFQNNALEKVLLKAIENHLEDLGKEAYGKIAKELDITKEGVVQIADFIRSNLNPHPTSSFGGETEHIIPSFVIEKNEQGNLKLINLEKQYGPVISLSERYIQMLQDPKTDQETIDFLRAKMSAAKDFLEQVQKRFETMGKIMAILLREQKEFADRGKRWLKPFYQKSIADEVGVHPSTISRAIAHKYVQTPHGLFPLKMLCPKGEGEFSIYRIQAMIKDFVDREDKSHTLSDQEIADAFGKEGLAVSRRTITHYRKTMNLPSYKERQS